MHGVSKTGLTMTCAHADRRCNFAHGEHELRMHTMDRGFPGGRGRGGYGGERGGGMAGRGYGGGRGVSA